MVDADKTLVRDATPDRKRMRQQQMRQSARQRQLKRLWKFVCTAGLLGGAIAIARLPDWRIQPLEDIAIEGNRILSDADLRPLLPVPEDVYLWQVEPTDLEAALLNHPLVRQAHVRRHLFPPHIEAWVEERRPVALSTRGGISGFLDRDGVWVARVHVGGRQPSGWPELSVIGVEQHEPDEWAQVLGEVVHSPVRIDQINWRSPQNLILQTELGEVHLGPTRTGLRTSGGRGRSPLSDRLAHQLQVLDSMRSLYRQCDCQPDEIVHIDLTRPQSPVLTLTEAAEQRRFQTETEAGLDFH